MSPALIGVIGIFIFIILMVLSVPIPFSMMMVGFIGIIILRNPQVASQVLVSELMTQFSSYALTVGALFGLMGFIANYTGLGTQLYKVVNNFMGHKRGGLAMATQVACAVFGAICGSVPATIGAFSAIAYPEMKKRNYDPGFSGASIAAGAQISTIIPPSATFIIYCMATNTSVGKQFESGILPGILLTIMNMAFIWFYVKLNPSAAPRSERIGRKERFASLKNGSILQVVIVFIISMGGMFAGFFTPSEAGAVGSFGMIIVTLAGRQINLKKFVDSCIAGVELQTMVLVLLGCASVFSRFINLTTIPTVVGGFCQSLLANGVPSTILVIVIILLFFILGMFMDLISVTLMTIPVFFPIIVTTLGYSPLWFGVIISLLICLGGLTPPMGASIFMVKNACKDKDLSVSRLFSASWPFFVSFLIVDILLVFAPQIVTWLPSILGAA